MAMVDGLGGLGKAFFLAKFCIASTDVCTG
jgi:hypothetical protein